MIGPLAGRVARRKGLPHRLRSASSPRSLHIAPGASAPAPRQRRKSSSKTSSPPGDGERAPPSPPAEAPAKDTATVPRKRAGTRSSTSRSKENASKAASTVAAAAPYNVPSVPSTQHLNYPDVNLASFFSLHRPISVDSAVPPASTKQAFSQIFAARKPVKAEPLQVILTLSNTVKALDQTASQAEQQQARTSPLQQPNQHQSSNAADLKTAVSQALNGTATATDATHLDGQPYITLNELVKNFRPFAPPPAPLPMPDVIGSAAAPEHPPPSALDLPSASLDESQMEAPLPSARQPFLDRMRQRQEVWERVLREQHDRVWRAISVRRQRKLKMKKHKYKKLMRRLRNLKRKQDRL